MIAGPAGPAWLLARGAPHASALARTRAVRCALNQQLTKESAAIPAGAEVAFFRRRRGLSPLATQCAGRPVWGVAVHGGMARTAPEDGRVASVARVGAFEMLAWAGSGRRRLTTFK